MSYKINPNAKVLYYPGCTTNNKVHSAIGQVGSILEKLGVEYNIFREDTCCGFPLYDVGLTDHIKEVAAYTLNLIQKYNPEIVITTCPGCLKAIRDLWKDICALEYDFQVLDISEYLLPLITSRLESRKVKVTWHDPCVLGRDLGIYEPPRNILRSIAGLELVEMHEHHEKSACCGGGGGVMLGFPVISAKMARSRIAQAQDVEADELVTSCPACYVNLNNQSRKSGIKVRFITDVIDEVLRDNE